MFLLSHLLLIRRKQLQWSTSTGRIFARMEGLNLRKRGNSGTTKGIQTTKALFQLYGLTYKQKHSWFTAQLSRLNINIPRVRIRADADRRSKLGGK